MTTTEPTARLSAEEIEEYSAFKKRADEFIGRGFSYDAYLTRKANEILGRLLADHDAMTAEIAEHEANICGLRSTLEHAQKEIADLRNKLAVKNADISDLCRQLAEKDIWQPMITAPIDGTTILAASDNGCAWEYVAVYWNDDGGEYPWQSADNAYPEDRFDSWQPLKEPKP